MRTEIITPDLVSSYYTSIPDPFLIPIKTGKMKAVGALFSESRRGAIVFQETEEGKGILKSLYIVPEARRLGLGSMLLKSLAGRVWSFSYEATGERVSLAPFFDNNNIFYDRYDYPVGRVSVKKAIEALREKRVDKASMIGRYYDELVLEEKKEVIRWLAETCSESPVDYTSLNPASVFYLHDGKMKNALLFSRADRGNLGVDYVICAKGEEIRLAGMMSKAMQLLMRQFRPDAEITMMMTTEQGQKLYTGLFGETEETVPVISGTLDGDQVWADDFDEE